MHCFRMYLYVSGDIWCISMFLWVWPKQAYWLLLKVLVGKASPRSWRISFTAGRLTAPKPKTEIDRRHPKTESRPWPSMTFPWLQKKWKSQICKICVCLCLSRVSWNTWTLRDNWAASSTAFLSRFHENTTCKKLDTRLDRQAWHNGADVLKVVLRLCSQPVHTKKPSVFPVFRVWQCDTKALVISVLTTVDMLYGANDLSRAQPCQVEYRTFRTWRCSHCYGWV